MQRLNRKALTFLAGIVGLLLLTTLWMVRSATSGEEGPARSRDETIVIPDLPRVAETAEQGAVADAVDPIEMRDAAPAGFGRHLPPLPPPDTPMPPPRPDFALPPAPSPESLLQRRMAASGAAAPAAGMGVPDAYAQAMMAGLQAGRAGPATSANDDEASPLHDASSARFIDNPDALLVRGSYIRCVLETRIITDIPGFTSCVVTEPVYSINGRRLLLQKGSKISGKYNNSDPSGPRVSVIWDRITTPGGVDVSMASPGVDNLGGAGHTGDYSAHWMSRMSAALMISLVSDAFKYAGAEYGPSTASIANGVVVQSPYESSTARTVERLANHALDRGVNRPATVTIDQGVVINVYVARDIDFSDVLAVTR